ncbi:MAG: hypothetical protein JNK41_10130 [Saprospiraceae bacterium]|jgi:predicted MFS family arabinose efflux permease|nr:hypothetical protein [Saprospiraceae bacterium]
MGEKLIAVVAGMVAAVLCIVLFDGLNHLVYPPPPGFSYENPDMLKKFMFNAPFVSKTILVLGLIIAGITGGFVSSKFDKTSDQRIPLVVGGLLFVQYAFNFYSIPHPPAITIIGLVMVVPAARFGYLLYVKYLGAQVKK